MVASIFPFISIFLCFFLEKKVGKVLMVLWLCFLLIFIIDRTQKIIETNNRIEELQKVLNS